VAPLATLTLVEAMLPGAFTSNVPAETVVAPV
jgi:hypothetical protein